MSLAPDRRAAPYRASRVSHYRAATAGRSAVRGGSATDPAACVVLGTSLDPALGDFDRVPTASLSGSLAIVTADPIRVPLRRATTAGTSRPAWGDRCNR